MLEPGFPTPGIPSLLRLCVTPVTKCRNIYLLPINYASRPRLRSRLTLRRLTLRRKPWTFGVRVFLPHYRYSCQHSHFWYLQLPSQVSLHRRAERSPTTHTISRANPQLRWIVLAPLHLPRRPTRPVSYYAFFKRWLLLSQLPGCLCLPTSFAT